jgi:hypothetical protein
MVTFMQETRMTDGSVSGQQSIWADNSGGELVRTVGATASERYLGRLCDRSFLSLWSYPGIFRDQGRSDGRGDGKEVCDLLVVCGDHVIIFSDKACEFPGRPGDPVAWGRWYKKAVLKSAEQVWGAERWICNYPSRLFLDKHCSSPFPLVLPAPQKAKFHRVVVAHGASHACRSVFGGSGSLMLHSNIAGDAHLTRPFTIGRIDNAKGFVHVFDDTSLDVVLETLDTISDFVRYLTRKEALMTGSIPVIATGEEELLARYFSGTAENQQHDFMVPRGCRVMVVGEGGWASFCASRERKAQLEANTVSYLWDRLIEKISSHLREGTFKSTVQGIGGNEKSLRWMAKEDRWKRRLLADALKEILSQTQPDIRATRIVKAVYPGEPYYVFVLLPHYPAWNREEYRRIRAKMIGDYCVLVRQQFPDAEHVVGIAVESGDVELTSLDASHFDASDWTPELAIQAKELKRINGAFVKPITTTWIDKEYPTNSPVKKSLSRNSPCHCGSGKRYKWCCGKGLFRKERLGLFEDRRPAD